MTPTSPVGGIAADITGRVLALEGVTSGPHRFGGTEFRLEPFELGHIHGDQQADVLVGKAERARLVATGLAQPHHLYPLSGWVTILLRTAAEPAGAVDRAVEAFAIAHRRRSAGPERGHATPA